MLPVSVTCNENNIIKYVAPIVFRASLDDSIAAPPTHKQREASSDRNDKQGDVLSVRSNTYTQNAKTFQEVQRKTQFDCAPFENAK
jgi:hypothetical protein